MGAYIGQTYGPAIGYVIGSFIGRYLGEKYGDRLFPPAVGEIGPEPPVGAPVPYGIQPVDT